MLPEDLNLSFALAPYCLLAIGEYYEPQMLLQPQWLPVYDNQIEYPFYVMDMVQVPCFEPIEQASFIPEPIHASIPDPPPEQVIKPPLQVPQSVATQTCRDESPDKFILSVADQKAFRKLHPLRKPLLPARNPADQRPTLVLDLDETLIHTSFETPPESQEYECVTITVLASTRTLFVSLRPWVRTFLKTVAQWYEIIIYTASLSTYANSILDMLDPTGEIFNYRLYREHCSFFRGVYVKDLEALGRPLETTTFVDNFPGAYMMQPSNALPVRSFVGDTNDNELVQLMKLLKILRFKDDVRPLLRRYQLHWKNIHFSAEQSKSHTED